MNSLPPADPLNSHCASRRFIELVADKWTMLVLWALRDEPRRNGELLRRIEGISQKMLTQTLRQLENHGLVLRADMGTIPPHVEYSLSELGQSLNEVMLSLDDWFARQLIRFQAASPHQS